MNPRLSFSSADVVIAEVEHHVVEVAQAGALDGLLDELVVGFLVNDSGFVIAVRAVDADLAVIGFAILQHRLRNCAAVPRHGFCASN